MLEDIYMPYKPKRRTRAQVARENGLETAGNNNNAATRQRPETTARRFINENVKSEEDAIKGAWTYSRECQ